MENKNEKSTIGRRNCLSGVATAAAGFTILPGNIGYYIIDDQ